MVETDRLIHQLQQTARAILKDLNLRFERHGVFGAEWGILSTLKRRGPMCQAELASYLSIEPPAISKSLLKLEGKAFIERGVGHNRRQKLVRLTDTAEALYPRLQAIVEDHHRHIMAGIGEDEKAALFAILTKLYANSSLASLSD